jgi:hypothetical protein
MQDGGAGVKFIFPKVPDKFYVESGDAMWLGNSATGEKLLLTKPNKETNHIIFCLKGNTIVGLFALVIGADEKPVLISEDGNEVSFEDIGEFADATLRATLVFTLR